MPTWVRPTLLTFLIWLPVIGVVDAAPTSTAQKYDSSCTTSSPAA